MAEMKRIPIVDAKTGETRYSEPMKQQGPRSPFQEMTNAESDGVLSNTRIASEQKKKGIRDTSFEPSAKKSKKKKIETLAQYIENAYSLKGRGLSLKANIESAIGRDPRLSEDEQAKLMMLAKADVLLNVPRQLLLAARDVSGFPALRSAFRAFVRDVLVGHPFLADSDVQKAIRNLDEAISVVDVLRRLGERRKAEVHFLDGKPLKAIAFEQLRLNAIYCVAVWLADMKGMSLPSISDALFRALWSVRGEATKSETNRLRAITNISELAGVGLACEEYQRQAMNRLVVASDAETEVERLREIVEVLEKDLAVARDDSVRTNAEVSSIRQALEGQLAAQKSNAENEITHMRDELEKLKARTLRLFKSDLQLLEGGLHALTRVEPKVHVMIDASERVIDKLRQEIRVLEKGE